MARPLGLRIPVRPAKGYSLTLQPPPGTALPRIALVDATLHVAVVPVGEDRLRIHEGLVGVVNQPLGTAYSERLDNII